MSTEEFIFPANAPSTRASHLADVVRRVSGLPTDKAYTVSIKAETRSLRQNRAWHAVVVRTIADHARDHFGEDHGYDVWHEYLRDRFLPATEHAIGRSTVQMRASTAKLSRAEFNELIERVQAWAAESLSLQVPDPDPEWRATKTEGAPHEH